MIAIIVIQFTLWEVYENAAAVKAHFASAAFGELFAAFQTGSLLDRPPIIECNLPPYAKSLSLTDFGWLL
jgi:hypothetical protein